MGKQLSKSERIRIVREKEQAEYELQQAYQKSARLNQSFVRIIEAAQNLNLRNEYANNERYQFMVSFLIQAELVTKKEILRKYKNEENLVYVRPPFRTQKYL
ncbi:MAG: hypothetical protein ACOVO2_18090 [Emticicia sp.]|uniref:hypothetical protein n=1 Tax=Emticicia sp. TaxID=1930953 RepID=UPI003BA77450